jgi:hypothetical protein
MGWYQVAYFVATIAFWVGYGFVANAQDTGPKQGTGVLWVVIIFFNLIALVVGLIVQDIAAAKWNRHPCRHRNAIWLFAILLVCQIATFPGFVSAFGAHTLSCIASIFIVIVCLMVFWAA